MAESGRTFCRGSGVVSTEMPQRARDAIDHALEVARRGVGAHDANPRVRSDRRARRAPPTRSLPARPRRRSGPRRRQGARPAVPPAPCEGASRVDGGPVVDAVRIGRRTPARTLGHATQNRRRYRPTRNRRRNRSSAPACHKGFGPLRRRRAPPVARRTPRGRPQRLRRFPGDR